MWFLLLLLLLRCGRVGRKTTHRFPRILRCCSGCHQPTTVSGNDRTMAHFYCCGFAARTKRKVSGRRKKKLQQGSAKSASLIRLGNGLFMSEPSFFSLANHKTAKKLARIRTWPWRGVVVVSGDVIISVVALPAFCDLVSRMWSSKATAASKRVVAASAKAFSSQAAKPAEPVLARVRADWWGDVGWKERLVAACVVHCALIFLGGAPRPSSSFSCRCTAG